MTSATKEHGEPVMKPNDDGLEDFIDFLGEGCGPLLETARMYAKELLRARIELRELRQRPTPERMELPQGVKRVDEQRLREIMSGYMEFHAPDDFEIRALAYEVRNWRGLAAVSDAALESAASATSGRAASAAKVETCTRVASYAGEKGMEKP